jgi:glycosyltransferase involved in cell wall biosynthesis
MTLVGRVPDTRCYYQAADLLVQPSRSEGLSIVLLEGMASGLAIVATAVPGNLEVIESGVSGVLVPPAEPGPLAAAIQELLTDPERRRRLGAGARAAVLDRFRLEAVEERWANVYASLA